MYQNTVDAMAETLDRCVSRLGKIYNQLDRLEDIEKTLKNMCEEIAYISNCVFEQHEKIHYKNCLGSVARCIDATINELRLVRITVRHPVQNVGTICIMDEKGIYTDLNSPEAEDDIRAIYSSLAHKEASDAIVSDIQDLARWYVENNKRTRIDVTIDLKELRGGLEDKGSYDIRDVLIANKMLA
jgi:hypothetical protein